MRDREANLDDTLLDELRRANPVRAETLPSSRGPQPTQKLEEIIMASTPPLESQPAPEAASPIGGRRRRRLVGSVAAAAVAIAAITVGVFAFNAGTAPDATALVHTAAETTESGSLSWNTTVAVGLADFDDPLEFSVAGTVSDGNSEVRWGTLSDMASLGLPDLDPVTVVIVGDQGYLSLAEGSWEGPRPASEFQLLSGLTADAMIDGIQQLADFTRVGEEEVDGQEWTRYQTQSVPDNAIRSTLMLTFGYSQMLSGANPGTEVENPQLDIWIDGENLIRRVSFTIEMGGGSSFAVTTDFYGFGEPTDITAPPT